MPGLYWDIEEELAHPRFRALVRRLRVSEAEAMLMVQRAAHYAQKEWGRGLKETGEPGLVERSYLALDPDAAELVAVGYFVETDGGLRWHDAANRFKYYAQKILAGKKRGAKAARDQSGAFVGADDVPDIGEASGSPAAAGRPMDEVEKDGRPAVAHRHPS